MTSQPGHIDGRTKDVVVRNHLSLRIWQSLAVLGWLTALGVVFLCARNVGGYALNAQFAVGLTDRDITHMFGPPEPTVTRAEQFRNAPFALYRPSTRPISARVLVYFRQGHMVTVYLNTDNIVECVFWGDRIRTSGD